jgi:uncharacterized protein (UPF0332 family)
MSFNPILFINVAKDLHNSAKTEEASRSVVSRAYYGAFGHIKKKLNFSDLGTSTHQKLIENLKYSNIKEYKIVSKKLEALFKKRKLADYCYHDTFTESCQYCIEEAESIIVMFDSYSKEDS